MCTRTKTGFQGGSRSVLVCRHCGLPCFSGQLSLGRAQGGRHHGLSSASSMHAYMHACMCVYTYMHICVYACMYVCMSVRRPRPSTLRAVPARQRAPAARRCASVLRAADRGGTLAPTILLTVFFFKLWREGDFVQCTPRSSPAKKRRRLAR